MKLVWIPILALMIALTSIVSDHPSMCFSHDQISSLHSISTWETDSLRHSENKQTEKNNLIAQDFIPIVFIADQWSAIPDFHHYIPLYSLVREKEYFLLI